MQEAAPLAQARLDALSLGYLSLPGATASDVIDAAAWAGLTRVGLRVAGRGAGDQGRWLAHDAAYRTAVMSLLRDRGLQVHNVAGYVLGNDTPAVTFRPILECAAALGATFVCVSGYHADERETSDEIAALAAAADHYQLQIALEFVPYSKVRSLPAAQRVVTSAGARNVGILLDMLHFMRSNGSLEELRGVQPNQLAFVQICDGPAAAPSLDDLAAEARGARLHPGEGDFPVEEILRALPADIPIEIEVPHAALRGRPPAEQAAVAVQRVRAFLTSLEQVPA